MYQITFHHPRNLKDIVLKELGITREEENINSEEEISETMTRIEVRFIIDYAEEIQTIIDLFPYNIHVTII